MSGKKTTPTGQAAEIWEGQSDEEMIAEVVAARKAGTLKLGGLPIERPSGSQLVPVLIRMPASMVDALKVEATRQGVRGYQTLMKQWIQERLTGERVVSVRQIEDSLRPLRRLVDSPRESVQ